MTLLWIAIGAVEVCVLLFIVAAAVIALASRPGAKTEAETYFYAGEICVDNSCEPGLTITVDDDYRTTIARHGLSGLTGGAASIAVTVTGAEVYIEERITPGRLDPTDITPYGAIFLLDCMPPNTRIHFRYNSSAESRSVSQTFTVKPGFNYTLPLSH
ncbi:MAG: hypothetical protein K2G47_10875 [Muribaculum sp.]|nr:hypothetical protein [Muribaculum sp.]